MHVLGLVRDVLTFDIDIFGFIVNGYKMVS